MGRLTAAPVLLLIVCSTLVFGTLQTRAQTDYTIKIRGYTWDHTTITVNIIPQQNMSWWKPEYLDAATQGIAQWNDAIQEFAQNNPSFSNFSQVKFEATTDYESASVFDVHMNWIAECESEATIGKTETSITFPCHALNSTVCLAAKSPSGHVMTEVDMQNIVVHELGHVFGLSHCNISSDVMYPTVYYQDTVKPLSTLNLYGVAQIFELTKASTCPEEDVLTMPQSISYSQLQIAPENNPTATPQNLTEYTIKLLLRPEVVILVGLAVVVSVALFGYKKKNSAGT